MTSQKGRKIVSPQLSLRLAEETDCDLLWWWRNEEDTRKWFFDSAYVPYEEHRKWFVNKLRSGNTKILIVLDENKKEVGQVRFDISQDKSAEIDISIDAKERNKGYGSSALKVACHYALGKFNIAKVIAHTKEENKASITAFTKAGFINKGLRGFRGFKAIQLVLERK